MVWRARHGPALTRHHGVQHYCFLVDHEGYARDVSRAVELSESGRLEEAALALRALASDPDVPFPDRAIQLMNLALTFTKLNRLDEAEAAYDEGIAIEDRLLRGFMREHKAAWLIDRGRLDEAAAQYEWLLGQYWLDSPGIRRCEQNLAAIRGPR